jgi:hypothetical protein
MSVNNTLINSARGVTQFDFNGVLVTIIGELHDKEFICKSPNMSIFEYCETITTNNTRFMLEYHPESTQYDRIGSKVIRDFFLTGPNKVKSSTVGIDIRSDFLTRSGQQKLYHSNGCKIDDFPTYTKKWLLSVIGHPTTPDLKKYVDLIDDKFKSVLCILDLKWAWSMVMDYKILFDISNPSNSNVKEFVIIVGNNHLLNLRNIMSSWKKCRKLLDISDGNLDNCILSSELNYIK